MLKGMNVEPYLKATEERLRLQLYLNFCAGATADQGLRGSLYEGELVCNLPWASLIDDERRRIMFSLILMSNRRKRPYKNTAVQSPLPLVVHSRLNPFFVALSSPPLRLHPHHHSQACPPGLLDDVLNGR